MTAPGGGERDGGARPPSARRGWLYDLALALGIGWLRGAAKRLAEAQVRPHARTKAERALAVLPQIREAETASKWTTPPRMPEAIAWRVVVAIAVLTLAAYTIGVMLAYMEYRLTKAAQNPHPSVPSVIGQSRINLLVQPMFEVETGAYEQHDREARRLDSYGWVDRDAGLIHIPILRAMDGVLTPADAGAPSGSPP